MAASKQVSRWDFNGIVQWAGKTGIEWFLVPTGGQHFNGQAERMIGLIKKQIWRSFEGKKHSHEETITILQEATQVVISRPLTCSPWAEGRPLCPEDLMLGKARTGVPVVPFETGQQLVKRFKTVQQAKEEFWDRWVKEVFPSLLKHQKWYKYKRDTKVRDVVLKKDETAAGQTYKYARIIKVHVGSDGKVRAADIEYKVPGESKFRSITRPIHKLVLVVPVEEQTMEEEERPGDQDKWEGTDQGPEADVRNKEEGGLEHEEEIEKELQEPRGEEEQPAEDEADVDANTGAQERETVTEVERGLIPLVPSAHCQEGAEAIMDVGQAVKKGRGRPRKVEAGDMENQEEPIPPGPSKGSVTAIGTKMCVDPGGNGAILDAGGEGGPGPPGGDRSKQLVSDSGDG